MICKMAHEVLYVAVMGRKGTVGAKRNLYKEVRRNFLKLHMKKKSI